MSELPDDLRDEVIADLSTLLTRIHFPENARLLASVIERLHALPGWRKVGESEMPPLGSIVMIATRNGGVYIGMRIEGTHGDWLWKIGSCRGKQEDITHWMPLPAAPEVPS